MLKLALAFSKIALSLERYNRRVAKPPPAAVQRLTRCAVGAESVRAVSRCGAATWRTQPAADGEAALGAGDRGAERGGAERHADGADSGQGGSGWRRAARGEGAGAC